MQDHAVLGQVALGYSPMIDRQRGVVATRLTVFPERPDSVIDAAALLRAVAEVWPPDAAVTAAASAPMQLSPRPMGAAGIAAATDASQGARAATQPLVSLNLAGELLLRQVMSASPGSQMMVEVPAFMVAEAASAGVLQGLHRAGSALVLKGRPTQPLAPEVLALFSHAIVDADDERRVDAASVSSAAAAAGARRVATVQAGARSKAAVDAAFQRGAVAVLGWPWQDEPAVVASRSAVPSDVKTVMELVSGVDREEPVAKLEAVLRRDPTLAFRLMRYLNSPAFGMSVEINSFGHALMLLGYQRLKRWLALLLASSSKDANAKPLLYAAVRRGLLMEELGRENGPASDNSEMRGEMFICGVFSLLDRLLQQSMGDLLAAVPVPDRVQQALRGTGGPYLPYLDLVRAIEEESVFDLRQQAEALLLSPLTVNRALLKALHAARQLDA